MALATICGTIFWCTTTFEERCSGSFVHCRGNRGLLWVFQVFILNIDRYIITLWHRGQRKTKRQQNNCYWRCRRFTTISSYSFPRTSHSSVVWRSRMSWRNWSRKPINLQKTPNLRCWTDREFNQISKELDAFNDATSIGAIQSFVSQYKHHSKLLELEKRVAEIEQQCQVLRAGHTCCTCDGS